MTPKRPPAVLILAAELALQPSATVTVPRTALIDVLCDYERLRTATPPAPPPTQTFGGE
jgi:hypothetical protein